MFRNILLAYKWRKLRIRVWERRLLEQLSIISPQFLSRVDCSLRLSWGPFYGGSVIMNRSCTKAEIRIQIPYDRYITADEHQIMSRFKITKGGLPYFIFFNECFHLIDAISHIQQNKIKDLKTYQATLVRAAQTSADYRMVSFEKHADEFAYQQYLDLCEKAG